MMLDLPVGHFLEATAVWSSCVVLFVLIVALRRVWIERAKTLRREVRSGTAGALDPGGERPTGGRP